MFLEFRLEGVDLLDLFAQLFKLTSMGIAPDGFDEFLEHKIPFEKGIIAYKKEALVFERGLTATMVSTIT